MSFYAMSDNDEFGYWSDYVQDEKKKREQKKKDDELAKRAIEFMNRIKANAVDPYDIPMSVFQIRRQTSDDTHVLCGVYSSVQSAMDHFPYRTHSLCLSDCSQYIVAEMVKEEWETYTSPKIEFFHIIESKVI